MGHFDEFIARIAGASDATIRTDTSTDPGKAHWHQFAINLLRTVNTAEATYHIENGSYATWQTLLSSEPKYFDDFLARNRLIKFVYRGENVPRDVGLKSPSTTRHKSCPDGICG